MNPVQLRMAAREIFDEALRAVDPRAALRRFVRLESTQLIIGEGSFDISERGIYSVAIGKAALPLASALEEVLGERLKAGVIASAEARQGKTGAAANLSDRWEFFAGGHPVPNEASLAAANAAFDLLERANRERARVIFLVSGGGSSMMESPISDGITLADLREANSVLVTSGASISEINSVRRGFSAIKGGRLAARAPNCDQLTLIVSDVPPGAERYVASGPTLLPAEDALAALEVIERYGLLQRLPVSVMRAIERQTTPTISGPGLREHFVLLDNGNALKAALEAAEHRGFNTQIAGDILDGPIEVGCERLLARFADFSETSASRNQGEVCLISGGEFACPVRGDGLGGRNLETALRLARAADLSLRDTGAFVAICAGTDGIDGNTPAAGAIIDNTTMERAARIGLKPQDFLNRSDAYSFFVALGDVITTGPTGTNVRDLRILLRDVAGQP